MNDVEELGEEIASLSAHLDAATHRLLECIRRFDQANGWHEQGAISCAHWLAWRVGWDPGTAREKVRVARALGTLPAIDAALRTGSLSYAKVRALTRVATAETEGKLLEMALIATGAQLERLCRGYRVVLEGERVPAAEERSVCRRVLPGGMVKLELVLEPDEADLILRAVDRAREVRAEHPVRGEQPVSGLPQPQKAEATEGTEFKEAPSQLPGERDDVSAEAPWPSRADGMVTVAESFLAGHPVTGTGGERFQVMVHLDQEALGPDGAWAATLEDGTRVSAEAFRRIACDCGLVAVGHDGEALNIGRRARSIPPAIRRALMLRDQLRGVPRKGCAFPGCTHTRFLHAHHIRHWLNGGSTSLDNLALLCTGHHHLVHEGGWTITAVADGTLVFKSPAGRSFAPSPARERVDNILEWLGEWAEERNLDLGPETNMPRWDGKNPDYNQAVSWLLAAG